MAPEPRVVERGTCENGHRWFETDEPTCPEESCGQKLTYQESADELETIPSGGSLVVPLERHFYRCGEHGLFRYDGKFTPVKQQK
jgi:hypothetical protein